MPLPLCASKRGERGLAQKEMSQEHMRLQTQCQNMSQPRTKERGLGLSQKLLDFQEDEAC